MYDWDEEDRLHEDSIACTKHPDATIEKRVDGKWCRWWICPWCGGDGKHCDYVQTHKDWVPKAKIAAMPPLPGIARGHALILKPGEPGRLARCRICTEDRGSLLIERQCPGDQHICPAIVPAGTPGAEPLYRRPEWLCCQPGQMNADFTAWTCRAGHIITRRRYGHSPDQCDIPRNCPCDDLVPEPVAS
jgi:hypothetical protein